MGWDMIQRNTELMRNMVFNVLYYARNRDLVWQEIDIEKISAAVYDIMYKKAELLGIKMKADAVRGTFHGDYESVHSLLINVIDNSIDACRSVKKSQDEKLVSFSSKLQGNNVVFEIKDNGIGMDRETKEKAFSLFFTSKGTEGTGFGLFIANEIAKKHGGNIKIESKPEKGTTFKITLPLNQIT